MLVRTDHDDDRIAAIPGFLRDTIPAPGCIHHRERKATRAGLEYATHRTCPHLRGQAREYAALPQSRQRIFQRCRRNAAARLCQIRPLQSRPHASVVKSGRTGGEGIEINEQRSDDGGGQCPRQRGRASSPRRPEDGDDRATGDEAIVNLREVVDEPSLSIG